MLKSTTSAFMEKGLIRSKIILIYLVMMGISSPFMYAGGLNQWLVVTMIVSLIALTQYIYVDMNDLTLVAFLTTIISCSIINHPESLRWSTLLYTVLFSLSFIAYKNVILQKGLSISNFKDLLKWLIYAYTIVLIIQQLCVLVGLPIFNVMGNYDPTNPWKLNSLSGEPSWTSRRMGLMFFCYVTIQAIIWGKEYTLKKSLKEDLLVWCSFLWVMLTSISGTAIVFLVIAISKFINLRNIVFVGLAIIPLLSIPSLFDLKENPVDRAIDSGIAAISLDEKKILETDGSAAFRTIPIILGPKLVDITSIDGWFGHGIDYSQGLVKQYIPTAPKSMSIGSMWGIWLDYGFIAFILFLIFSIRMCLVSHDKIYSLIFWFMLVFINGINVQTLWSSIILLYTTNYFYKNERTVS